MTPTAREMGDKNYWKQTVKSILPSVLNEVSVAHSFDFVMDSYSLTWDTTTETLTGNNNDLLEVQTIRYGTPYRVLAHVRKIDILERVESGGTLGGVKAWYQSGVDNQGFPKITLVDAPSASATATVDYRKKNVPLADWPDDFEWVLVSGIMARLSPGMYYLKFRQEIKDMVRRYKVGGKDVNQADVDPQILATNHKIYRNYRSN